MDIRPLQFGFRSSQQGRKHPRSLLADATQWEPLQTLTRNTPVEKVVMGLERQSVDGRVPVA